MPNWCYSNLKITGNKEKTREFLRFGIKNPEFVLPESTVDIESAIENLPDGKKLCISAYYPQPDIIKAADTTNYPEKHPEIAEQQRKEFGVVGWYQWNTTYWGTKWDAVFDNVQYVESNDVGVITFFMDTAWAPPIPWLEYVQEQFPKLDFEMNYDEPGCSFCGVAGTVRDMDDTPEICDTELDWDEQHPNDDDDDDVDTNEEEE